MNIDFIKPKHLFMRNVSNDPSTFTSFCNHFYSNITKVGFTLFLLVFLTHFTIAQGTPEDPCEGCLNFSQLDELGSEYFAYFRLQVFNSCSEDTPNNVSVVITGANYSLPNIDGNNGVAHIESGVAPNIT